MRTIRKFSTITFRVPTDVKERMELYADDRTLTVSDICRLSILRELREWEQTVSDDPFGENEKNT